MANICINSLVFTSKNLNELKELHKEIKNIANDEEHNSVAELMRAYGYNEDDISLLCDRRDYFSFVDQDIATQGVIFSFHAETCSAWSENLDCINTLLQEKYKNSIHLYSQSEEEGAGLYTILDPTGMFFKDKFKVDACINDNYLTEYFSSYSDVISFLKSTFPKLSFCVFDTPSEVEEAVNDTLDLDTEDFFHLHVFEEYAYDTERLSNYYYSQKEVA